MHEISKITHTTTNFIKKGVCCMRVIREMKETLTDAAKDVGKLTKLTAQDGLEEVKQEVRKVQIQNTVDDLQGAYNKVKQNVHDVLHDTFHDA